MSDQRGYELADEISTEDVDVYFNVSKSGFSRTKKYKASVLKGHLKVGDQQYDEENYVTNDQTLTVSINALDIALDALSGVVEDFDGLKTIKVSLSSGQVNGLGSAFTLMSTPLTANTAYSIIDIKWNINPSVADALEVGSQDLEVYFDTIDTFVGVVRNVDVERSTRILKSIDVQGEHEVGINKALLCKLDGDANPSSGTATMDFYISYKVIVLPAAIT